MQALALQAPLHVGEREDDGVDLARADPGTELLEGQVAVVGRHGSPSISPAGRAGARPCRRSAPPWSGGPGRAARPARPARAAACWVSECVDVGLQHGDRAQHLVQAGLDRRDGLDDPGRPGQRGDRQVEPRVGLPVAERGWWPRATAGEPLRAGRARPVVEGRSTRPGRPHRARRCAGSRARRASRPVCAARRVVHGAGRAVPAAYRHDRAPAATPPRLDQPGRPERRDRLPQGGPRDLEPLGELALGRQACSPNG